MIILVKLGKDQSVKDRLEELSLRNITLEAFLQSLSHPKIVEDRFRQLKLENCPIQVIHYAKPLDIVELTDALIELDPDYHTNASKKAQTNEMSLISKLIKKFRSLPYHRVHF